MKRNTSVEESKLWRIPRFSNLELLQAHHRTQSFPLHTHEQYAIGVIERGALGFFYRGENVVAWPGTINLCIPGEPHTGQPAGSEGWSYRMFYFDPALLQQIASQVADCPCAIPYFQPGVIVDPVMAQQLACLHRQFELADGSLLEQETRLLDVLAQMIQRHADDPPQVYRMGQEPYAVTRLKEYMASHYSENISLETLSQLTHLSPYHLLRTFRAAVGIPPHAYLRQVRVQHAKELLAFGQPIADVALATGFTDQSHLTRWFKRLWGVTPAQFRNCVQDSFPIPIVHSHGR
ncbi:MAG: AraC family transcriptional regulator [Caldilinea sp. CFX5]|nr:AraC family transcriptional regulator [Caldilinea sp. CFX5]